jgi:hypothetical protein
LRRWASWSALVGMVALTHDMGGKAGLAAGAAPLEVVDTRPVGTTWLLDEVWRRLDVAAAIRGATDARRFTTTWNASCSRWSPTVPSTPDEQAVAAEWVGGDTVAPGLSMMDGGYGYPAMDLLVDATNARIQEAVFFAVANVLNLEVEVLFRHHLHLPRTRRGRRRRGWVGSSPSWRAASTRTGHASWAAYPSRG